MAKGHKTGGRVAGTHRRTQEIQELLESLGHNPIKAMVEIANNPKASLDLRGRMNAELLPYLYPRRKAVEVSGADGHAIEMSIAEELRAARNARLAGKAEAKAAETASQDSQ